jgi:hypothetical protein
MTAEQKCLIDGMTQEELCRKWRFAAIGDPIFQDDTGEYFRQKLKEKGGFTPEISKKLSW